MDMEEKKLTVDAAEQALPVQELPADIPAEVRQKLAEDLNDEATEDLKQDMREAEKEEANDEEVKANPEMLTKSRLLKMLVKKQYVKLREVTEEEQPADLAELLEELDENNRLVVFRLLKKEVATEAVERCGRKRSRDWATIKSAIKSDLSGYLYKHTKRNPMILPVIMEV